MWRRPLLRLEVVSVPWASACQQTSLHKRHPPCMAWQDRRGNWMENLPGTHHTLCCVAPLCDLWGSVIRQSQGLAAPDDARSRYNPPRAVQLPCQLHREQRESPVCLSCSSGMCSLRKCGSPGASFTLASMNLSSPTGKRMGVKVRKRKVFG